MNFFFTKRFSPQDITLRLFKFVMSESIIWNTVLEDSVVKCKKCIELIKATVLEANLNFSMTLSDDAAVALGFTLNDEMAWAAKFADEVAEMANDSGWYCTHVSENESTYFVDAIRAGVKQLMESYNWR